MTRPIVIKISGHQIDDAEFLTEFSQVIADMKSPVIIVHGGGKEISMMQEKMGIEPNYVDGVRVTDEATLAIVTMVLCGSVNKRLVRYLLAAGVHAQGLSGIDRSIVCAEKMHHPDIDMGYTGKVTSVNGAILQDMLNQAITPVLAPLCLGSDSHFNVNGDHVAGAVASAVHADRLIFLSNVEGVITHNSITAQLTAEEALALIDDGTIYGGMIPKVRTALYALQSGVQSVVITNLTGLQSHGGTIFIQSN